MMDGFRRGIAKGADGGVYDFTMMQKLFSRKAIVQDLPNKNLYLGRAWKLPNKRLGGNDLG